MSKFKVGDIVARKPMKGMTAYALSLRKRVVAIEGGVVICSGIDDPSPLKNAYPYYPSELRKVEG